MREKGNELADYFSDPVFSLKSSRMMTLRSICVPRLSSDDIKGHLNTLSDRSDGYIPNLSVDPWIQNPFTIPIDDIDDDNEIKDDLIEPKARGSLKMQFTTVGNHSEF